MICCRLIRVTRDDFACFFWAKITPNTLITGLFLTFVGKKLINQSIINHAQTGGR
ncbi:protein of unknown function [Pseudodesulfovibrio profundus]|uniref:Uncharacterized protein n=1 Tax=Pseudodesulfovibrio profundus TaxID=57320 RepID=A0A2C8FBA6_9BACT|nr:protein of unknown function [Pseudodesulfovibrio profundus]